MTHPYRNFFVLCFHSFVWLKVQGKESSVNNQFQKENDLLIQRKKCYTVLLFEVRVHYEQIFQILITSTINNLVTWVIYQLSYRRVFYNEIETFFCREYFMQVPILNKAFFSSSLTVWLMSFSVCMWQVIESLILTSKGIASSSVSLNW